MMHVSQFATTARAPQFSIVVPGFNAEESIEQCLLSVLSQQGIDSPAFEVLFVDDCSDDHTVSKVNELARRHSNLSVASTDLNGGPGAARNVGVASARGDWLVFVDSDDRLAPNTLRRLQQEIVSKQDANISAIGFNWCYGFDSLEGQTGRRKDQVSLSKPWVSRISDFLRLRMDGSVIFTAIRRDLIVDNRLSFADGLHEDVDFIFKVYWHAKRVAWVDEILYRKQDRVNSIVNTVSERHLAGFFRAWRALGEFTSVTAPPEGEQFQIDWQCGLTSLVATRAREIFRRASSVEKAANLYAMLHEELKQSRLQPRFIGAEARTQYERITHTFMALAKDAASAADLAREMTAYLKQVAGKSWGCTDLHHSVFLGPDEVRTCCKRFFVDGEIRGDVVLLNAKKDSIDQSSILAAKRALVQRVNQGDVSPCDGCSFMEFKDWGPIEQLDVRYLSMEYHSICNLKCSYCSDTYYGGKSPEYDVDALVVTLMDGHHLDACHTVVWGGGEPTVAKNFANLLEQFAIQLPDASQRVLTNSVKYSKAVNASLAKGQVAVTTSIDAGTHETFDLVRGKRKLDEVLLNLERYAATNAEKVTVKYIFTEDNFQLSEVIGYCDLIQSHHLTDCNFQISADFKSESISPQSALSMIVMYGLLARAGCRIIFFDDLLRYRLSDVLSLNDAYIRGSLQELNLASILADPSEFSSVAIWGAGWQAKYMMEHASFLQRVPVEYFVDETPAKIGTMYFDRPVVTPQALLTSTVPVIIAASQGFSMIYRSALALGLPQERLIRSLVL